MSKSLRVAKTYKIEWSDGLFFGDEDDFETLLEHEIQTFEIDENDSSKTYHVSKDELLVYLDKIKKSPKSINDYFMEHDNQDVYNVLQSMINKSEIYDDIVHFSWF